MPRLFIALPMSENSGNEKAGEIYNYLKKYENELKLVNPEHYHITLKFLGECSEKQAKNIEDNFESINNMLEIKKIVPYAVFGLGVFPDFQNINVIWAGIKTDETYINRLNQNIEEFASGLGFKKEKNKFTPHLTLARVRKGKKININVRQYLVENKEMFFYNSAFKKITLVSSTLTKSGPIYNEIKTIKLEG